MKSKTVTSTEVMETGVCPFQVSVGVVRLKTLVVDSTKAKAKAKAVSLSEDSPWVERDAL